MYGSTRSHHMMQHSVWLNMLLSTQPSHDAAQCMPQHDAHDAAQYVAHDAASVQHSMLHGPASQLRVQGVAHWLQGLSLASLSSSAHSPPEETDKHQGQPHQSTTPANHTSQPHQSTTPVNHTTQPINHTSQPHQSTTPVNHTSQPVNHTVGQTDREQQERGSDRNTSNMGESVTWLRGSGTRDATDGYVNPLNQLAQEMLLMAQEN